MSCSSSVIEPEVSISGIG